MKRIIITSLLIVMVLGIGVAFAPQDETGNGAPSGEHFTLNIIGVKEGKEKNMENCGEGHRIFVKLGQAEDTKKSKPEINVETDIWLIEGDDFAVLDCDGTDGDAVLQLLNPAPDTPKQCTAYSVWVRALGKPGGKADMSLCVTYTDPLSGDVWVGCSSDVVELERTKGQGHKQKFTNVSLELLTICVWVCTAVENGDCTAWEWERIYIFDDRLENEYWKYNNKGLKHAQIRFYYDEDCSRGNDWGCP